VTTTKEKITVTGNLTEDPVLNISEKGNPWVRARIAVNYGTGENKTTDYFDIRVWAGDFAPNFPENVSSSLKKGDRVTVTGRIEPTAYQPTEGPLRTGITIHADEISPSLRYATTIIERNPSVETAQGPGYGNARGRGHARAPVVVTAPATDDADAIPDPFFDDSDPF
jgi:single-strand DNA-binding protein